MPAPPARSFSASVPCGVSSSSRSPSRNWRSNSLFSPTYDDVILRMRRAASSTPSSQSSTPQLFEMIDRSVVPCASSASMRAMGLPLSPNPPTAIVAPSGMSATASAALATCLSITRDLLVLAHPCVPLHHHAAAASRRHPVCDVDEPGPSVHIMDTRTAVPGAQAIARAASLLRLVTAAGAGGVTVSDLARQAELTRPTTHRLLTALRHEGLVDQDDRTGTWMPGPELFLMG